MILKVRGVDPMDLDFNVAELVDKLNRTPVYDHNLRLWHVRTVGKGYGFRLRVTDSGGRGAGRVGPSQRRSVSACWHAHRDLLMLIFAVYPDADLSTSVLRYRGRDDFLNRYVETGWRNIGSVASPVRADRACRCTYDRGDQLSAAVEYLVEKLSREVTR